jgi:hypothetical protein
LPLPEPPGETTLGPRRVRSRHERPAPDERQRGHLLSYTPICVVVAAYKVLGLRRRRLSVADVPALRLCPWQPDRPAAGLSPMKPGVSTGQTGELAPVKVDAPRHRVTGMRPAARGSDGPSRQRRGQSLRRLGRVRRRCRRSYGPRFRPSEGLAVRSIHGRRHSGKLPAGREKTDRRDQWWHLRTGLGAEEGCCGADGDPGQVYVPRCVGDGVVMSRSVKVKPASRARRTGQVSATFSRRLTWSLVRWSGRWMVISTRLGVVSAS